MRLPIVLVTHASHPLLVALDLATGERRAIPSLLDGISRIDIAHYTEHGIKCGDWLIPANLNGEIVPHFGETNDVSPSAMASPARPHGVWSSDGVAFAVRQGNQLQLTNTYTGEVSECTFDSGTPILILDQVHSLDDLPLEMPDSRGPRSFPSTVEAATEMFHNAIEPLDEQAKETVLENARISVRLLHDYSGSPKPKCVSRFGGRPDAPVGFDWPDGNEGEKLSFFAHVDCAELAALSPYPVHEDGHLLIFFRAPNDEGPFFDGSECVVIHVPKDSDVEQAAWPTDLEAEHRFESFPMILSVEWTVDEDHSEILQREGITLPMAPPPLHRLFGWGDHQNNNASGHLVLQINLDSHLNLPPWGDMGIVTTTIDSPDQLDLDLANAVTQFFH